MSTIEALKASKKVAKIITNLCKTIRCPCKYGVLDDEALSGIGSRLLF
jgi:hypothetical protein